MDAIHADRMSGITLIFLEAPEGFIQEDTP